MLPVIFQRKVYLRIPSDKAGFSPQLSCALWKKTTKAKKESKRGCFNALVDKRKLGQHKTAGLLYTEV